jgi:hypothetical protein
MYGDVYVCMYVFMYVCNVMHVCMYGDMYVCMYVCIYVCSVVHVCVSGAFDCEICELKRTCTTYH